jgi:hypothetical protein
MPQLDLSTFSVQLYTLFVAFGLSYFYLALVLLPKIATVLKARQAVLGDSVQEAEFDRSSIMTEYTVGAKEVPSHLLALDARKRFYALARQNVKSINTQRESLHQNG